MECVLACVNNVVKRNLVGVGDGMRRIDVKIVVRCTWFVLIRE